MKITMKWLEDQRACTEGRNWFSAQTESDGAKVVEKLMAEKNFTHANWLVVRLLDRIGKIRYAVFAAEQVIDIFEKKYPDDNRPRKAIEAAKAVIENDCAETRYAAYAAYAGGNAAAYAAYAAANAAAYAAYAGGNAAAYAAYAAANAAAYAAYAADNAAYAAYAADNAAYAAYAAAAAMKRRIIEHGVELVREQDGKEKR